MGMPGIASRFLTQEAKALLTRLKRLKPYVLYMPMVSAAAISNSAQLAIERHMVKKRLELKNKTYAFLRRLNDLNDLSENHITPEKAQRLFMILRLKFNTVLDQLDIFADVLTQRSEHDIGIWLAGIDVLASDALEIPGNYYEAPPVICYLDRGHGAAIRRARTRLPGGCENPVAIIRVPRERMVGSGIASSLVHEVGHQGSALLDLVRSLRAELKIMLKNNDKERLAWHLYNRWISEIIADFWSVAKVGVASTLGLIGVVSLPRWFVFRMNLDDPHPFPWIRVKISCAIGNTLYPNSQWDTLAKLWESFYPKNGLDKEKQRLLAMLETTMPRFVALLANHRPKTLRGKSMIESMLVEERHPDRLRAYFRVWRASPAQIYDASPTLVFAVIGQAKADGRISPEEESRVVGNLLRVWAVGKTFQNRK